MRFKLIFAFLLVLSFVACNNDRQQRQAPSDMGTIKSTTLEVRNGPGEEPDNWSKAALFLTDYDRDHNHTSLYVTTNYRVSQNPKTILAETCTSGAHCGLTKAGDGISIDTIDLSHAHKQMELLGVKSHYDMPNDGDFNEGEVWIVNSVEQECFGCAIWVTTVAVELSDFKPTTDQVSLRYKVLEFRLRDNPFSNFHN